MLITAELQFCVGIPTPNRIIAVRVSDLALRHFFFFFSQKCRFDKCKWDTRISFVWSAIILFVVSGHFEFDHGIKSVHVCCCVILIVDISWKSQHNILVNAETSTNDPNTIWPTIIKSKKQKKKRIHLFIWTMADQRDFTQYTQYRYSIPFWRITQLVQDS